MESTVAIEHGALQGVRVGAVVHFRGIPYAVANRFSAPAPLSAGWQGVRDATRHGPACPQSPSRVEAVTGRPSALVQDEACLTLSVAAPATDGKPRPVMVWLHGGAYIVGAGSYEWYRPDALVSEGDVVVVNVTHRLGVFGYMRMPGVSPGNLGFLDQIAALRWVQRNIAAFGGDASNVTVFGESAGAHSIVALMSTPETLGLLRRAIVQSAHLGVGFTTVKRAERVARMLSHYLRAADPRDASVEQILFAQEATVMKLAGPAALNSTPPFGPIVGVAPFPARVPADVVAGVLHDQVDLLIGTTRDEMRAFFDINPLLIRLRRAPGIGSRVLEALTAAVTKRVFTEPARRLADAQAQAGASVYTYAFDWAPAAAPFGACHTIELPFVFGNEEAWRSAPMLGQTPWEQVDELGREVRRAWTRFARWGDPGAEGGAKWPKHRPLARPGRRFQ